MVPVRIIHFAITNITQDLELLHQMQKQDPQICVNSIHHLTLLYVKAGALVKKQNILYIHTIHTCREGTDMEDTCRQ